MLRTEFLLPFGIWRSGHLDDHRNRYITSQIPSIFHVRQNNFSLVFYYFCDFSMHFPLDQKKVVFFFGKWSYKMRPTEGNIMVDVSKCIAVIIPTSNNCVLINYVIKTIQFLLTTARNREKVQEHGRKTRPLAVFRFR